MVEFLEEAGFLQVAGTIVSIGNGYAGGSLNDEAVYRRAGDSPWSGMNPLWHALEESLAIKPNV